ncbi:ABC transporter permease [Caldicellulosiruptoraceae bacterium PP1]
MYLANEIVNIIINTLIVCLVSTIISFILGVPIGYQIRLRNFKGKKNITRLLWTLNGMPPVLAGLFIYLLFSNRGPFGSLNLLFTKSIMIIAQIVLILPVSTMYTYSLLKNLNIVVDNLAYLGIDKLQKYLKLISEFRRELTYIFIFSFSEAISEVGAVMIVGGNIQGETRVLTTAIVFEVSKGEFLNAFILGVILLIISYIINSTLFYLQGDVFD